MFSYFDKNNDGYLDKQELLHVLKILLNVDFSNNKDMIVDEYFLQADQNKDLLISFQEFQTWI